MDCVVNVVPKYGLFDFFETESVDVALMSDILWSDDEKPSNLDAYIKGEGVLTLKWYQGCRGKRGKKKCMEPNAKSSCSKCIVRFKVYV